MFSYFLTGQEQQDTTSIGTESLEVIRNYEAIIQQAQRKKIEVEHESKEYSPIVYSYNINSEVNLDFERPQPVIRPKTFKVEDNYQSDIKDGRLYAGYGNYNTLALGGTYHYYIEDWIEAGIKIDHFSAKDKNVDFQKYNDTKGNLYFGYLLSSKNKIKVNVFGGQDNHFSPTDTQDTVSEISQQKINNIGGQLSFIHNSFDDTGIALRARGGYEIMNQVDNADNKRFKIEGNILKKISENLSFEIPLEFRSNSFKVNEEEESISYSDFDLAPFLRHIGDNFRLKAGLQYIKADSQFIFPIFELEYPNILEQVTLKLFTDSKFKRNDIFHLGPLVPYYQAALSPLTPNFHRSINLALNRQLGFAFGQLRFGYHIYDGDEFLIDRSVSNRIIASSLDRKDFQINPSIFIKNEKVNLNLDFVYNIFLGDNKDFLLYRPKYKLALSAEEWILNNKLRLTQDISFVGTRRHMHPSENTGELKSFIDVGLGLDYRISKTIGVFVKGSNLLASEYQVWFGHDVFERQVWGGLKFDL